MEPFSMSLVYARRCEAPKRLVADALLLAPFCWRPYFFASFALLASNTALMVSKGITNCASTLAGSARIEKPVNACLNASSHCPPRNREAIVPPGTEKGVQAERGLDSMPQSVTASLGLHEIPYGA